uniref:Exonuclease domain-containing protein n=1 Tax=Ditylum brightwellii TaxID=49249 RepID=A0A7S2A3F4_9STRA|mmetsp:Transcript_7642/g.11402  ORF Transcript_7642/g.11402 Transcript_7642/m.11402 type:complete len:636 (+) Transcript_7642:74-1981(+)
MEDIKNQWDKLQANAPKQPKSKPSPEQLSLLQEHKKCIKTFLDSLTEEQRILLKQGTKQEESTAPKHEAIKKKKKKQSKEPTTATLQITPKKHPVSLGWDDSDSKQTFEYVIPFYSHKNRSTVQEEEDESLYNGFDRRMCSNLYLPPPPGNKNEKGLQVPKLLDPKDGKTNLMRWDFLSATSSSPTNPLSSEHYFQAAKCQYEYDAKFIMSHLNSLQAAEYGQSRMYLTSDQKEQLVQLGADPINDFKKIVSYNSRGKKLSNNGKLLSSSEAENVSEASPVWVRGSNRLLPRRDDWEDVKAFVMLHIVRHKFGGSKSVQALLSLPSIPLFVEHTKNDSTWGDGCDGSGSNFLGKAITQVLLELSGNAKPALYSKKKNSNNTNLDNLRRPNNELVDYSYPQITLPSSSSSNAQKGLSTPHNIDYLCILDFEATCNDAKPAPKPQEIIEFPTLLLNTQTGNVEQEFHFYIRPDVHPTLSEFCTDLTGITQDVVNSGVTLKEALYEQQRWFSKSNLVPYTPQLSKLKTAEEKMKNDTNSSKSFLFVTCGDWDLKSCLPRQLSYHNQRVPHAYKRWINVKHAFRDFYKIKPNGMTHMLRLLDMELIGRHHSGIDDCRNIGRICSRMLKDGWRPKQTNDI